MKYYIIQVVLLWAQIKLILCEQFTQYPQGYYPFEESPAKIPPKVRKPPYLQTQVNCPGVGGIGNEQTLDNLCGDLNKGYLPLNPTGQTIDGVSYPFDLIKKKTLEFFSKTLPILKADDTLPKVAKYSDSHIAYNPSVYKSQQHNRISFYHHRTKRSVENHDSSSSNSTLNVQDPPMKKEEKEKSDKGILKKKKKIVKKIVKEEKSKENVATATASSSTTHQSVPRQGRGWCDDSYGVVCMIFNAFKGGNGESNPASSNSGGIDRDGDPALPNNLNSLESPMTPCPSAVEYVTPVFAKNYQGVWRYVVQIPYEGYFTQTVEVVKCLSTKCKLLDGSCLASPRWVSLLVAEIYYPDATFPDPSNAANSGRKPVKGGTPPTDYNKLFLKRSGTAASSSSDTTEKCDGRDDLGCYQVRLYYDWFLIPGSCKCWRNDYFEQYAKRK